MANESSLLAQPSGCAGLLIGAIHLILPCRIVNTTSVHLSKS